MHGIMEYTTELKIGTETLILSNKQDMLICITMSPGDIGILIIEIKIIQQHLKDGMMVVGTLPQQTTYLNYQVK